MILDELLEFLLEQDEATVEQILDRFRDTSRAQLEIALTFAFQQGLVIKLYFKNAYCLTYKCRAFLKAIREVER